MKYYIDLKILPDAEIPINFILNKTYSKLHKVLVTLNATDIAVSFPHYKTALGDVIRVHSTKDRLVELQALNWLGGLSGYCNVGKTLPIPTKIEGYRLVSRMQQTMSLKKLEQRIIYQKEKGILRTAEEIKAYKKQYITKMDETKLNTPYLELESVSNGNKYRRYIQLGEVSKSNKLGNFDQFGLSKDATIPWF